MAEPEITVHESAAENGLAGMVAELMRENTKASPLKARAFARMKGSVGITATDAEVSLTLVFDRGRCVVYDGVRPGTKAGVTADSDSILELSNVRIVGGLPHLFDATGKAVFRKVLAKTIRLRGLLRHPVLLTRLAVVLSVN